MSNKTPKIRFAGFNDNWEVRKLGEVADFINGRAYSQNELLDNGKYKVLRVGNFYTNESWYYSNFELSEKQYANCGDLLYTWSATFGPHIWLGDKVIYHYHIWKLELSSYLTKYFAVYLLEQDKANILSNKNGSTMVHITKTGMEQKKVTIPQSPAEQERIGQYFSRLDDLIGLYKRKLEKSLNLKKAMLEKMFPQNGKPTPKIRFAGFNDNWAVRKLGEVAYSYSGGTPQVGNSEYYNGEIPFIRSGEIYNKYTELFITQKGIDNSSAKMVSKGDILYALYGATSGEVNRACIDGAINQAILAIIPNKNHNADFIVEWFRREKNTIIDKYIQGGQGNLSAQIIKNLDITFPTHAEQQRIGEYFSRLDDLIGLYKRKLEKSLNLKKAMLEKMFP